jgi:hypothetical protein
MKHTFGPVIKFYKRFMTAWGRNSAVGNSDSLRGGRFTITSVGSTQSPVQWVPCPFPPWKKLLRRSADCYPHLATRLNMSRTICTSEVLSVPAWYVTERPLTFRERVEEVNIALKWTSL